MSFTCSGCGETHPFDPSLAIYGGTVFVDGESYQLDGKRYCADCAPFIEEIDNE